MPESLIVYNSIAFFGTVMGLAVAELIIPARRPTAPVSRRWITNFGLFFVDVVVQRIGAPVSAVIVAEAVMRSGNGALQHLGGPSWVAVLLGVLLLDLWKYAEHRLVHWSPILWRMHLVHHCDVDVDFTTTERHHPLEVIFGGSSTIAAIFLLGIPPLAVALYLMIATISVLFSHANIRVNDDVNRWLSRVLVTPSFHTIHHSAERRETDSNYGTILTVWDRIFGTFRTSTLVEDGARVIGLDYFRNMRTARLDQVLCLPFRALPTRRQSINTESDGARLAP